MGSMVDTCVLAYATRRHPKDTNELIARRQDCRALLRELDSILISPITHTEFFPYLTREERREHADTLSKLDQVEMDALAGQIATELITKHLQRLGLCRRCWNVKKPGKCKACGNSVSRQQRLNDFYIAASAAASEQVDTLYTYDFLHLAEDLADRVTIIEPPSASGPLFEANQAAAVLQLNPKNKG